MAWAGKWGWGGSYNREVSKHRKTNLLRESARPLPSRAEFDWFREKLMEWAKENGRDFPWRHTDDEYRIVVTEILLQQTTASAVTGLYESLFAAYPDWKSLDAAPETELRERIAVLGLGSQRARRLKALASWVAEHDWRIPATREELEDVPGVGQYVASALLAVKYGQPEPMLDVNMARVLERFFGERELADIRDDPWLQTISRLACGGAEAGWAVLDLGAAVCRPDPYCNGCPTKEGCVRTAGASAGRHTETRSQ